SGETARSLTEVSASDDAIFVASMGSDCLCVSVSRLRADSGVPDWRVDLNDAYYVSQPAYARGRVFFETSDGTYYGTRYLVGLNPDTGADAFRVAIDSPFASRQFVAPTPYLGDLLVTSQRGFSSDDQKTGALHWSGATVFEEGWTPTVEGDRVFSYPEHSK